MPEKISLQEALLKFSKLAAACNYELSSEMGILDLKIRYTNTLKIIGGTENVTYGMLAKILKITKPSVTDLVNNLINLGYAKKLQSPEDKRIFYIILTEKGKKLTEFEWLRSKKLADIFTASLSEKETSLFVKLIEKIDNGKKG